MKNHMPAEWAFHKATWLAWPSRFCPSSYENIQDLQQLQEMYLGMIEALCSGEKVRILIPLLEPEEPFLNQLKRRGVDPAAVEVIKADYQDIWIRDYGPTFVLDERQEKAWCKWKFNAWGNKYKNLVRDGNVFERGKILKDRCFPMGFVFEGGAIEVNGRGVGMTSESCLIHGNRNPGWTKMDYEKALREALGIRTLLWLPAGLPGDDTDGHIDQIARFVNERTVLLCQALDPGHGAYRILKQNKEALLSQINAKKVDLEIVDLPLPGPVEYEGRPLPASYANFYIGNHCVLLPVYGDAQDKPAAALLKTYFPQRRIVPVGAESLIRGLGSVHCITQQEPAAGV